jgi:CAAX protease family protein
MPVDGEERLPGTGSKAGNGARPDATHGSARIISDPEWPQERQPWSYAFQALLVTLAIIIVALAAPMVLVAITSQISMLAGRSKPWADPSDFIWLSLLSFQATVVVLAVLMSRVAPGNCPGLGWRPLIERYSWVQPLLLTIAVSAVVAGIAFTFFPDLIARDIEPIRKMVASGPQWLALAALVIGAPLSEELLFRGYLLHRLRQTPLGFWGAALIANIGWTLLHVEYSWLSLTDVFIAGLLFSWALWRTQSIWVPIAFHAIYNAVVFAIFLIPSSKPAAPAVSMTLWHAV